MAKIVAVTLVLITIASAVPIIAHVWVMPVDISTHGHLIDEQMSSTMAEAGISFIAAQLLLAIFIWMFSGRKPDAKIHTFPGGANRSGRSASCSRRDWRNRAVETGKAERAGLRFTKM